MQERIRMKALVTGSNGFIGSHLVEALIGKGYEVHGLVRKASNLRWLKGLNVELHTGDCVDKKSLHNAVRDMDWVYHVGGIINGKDWLQYYRVNCEGTKNLAEACIETNPKLRKFVFISSISAAGPGRKGEVIREEDEPNPTSDYGKSKLIAEQSLVELKDKLPVTIIRPSTILGKREDDFLKMLKLVKRRIIPVIGNGDGQTSLCFVDDLVRGIILAGESDKSKNQVYFIADGNVYSWHYVIGLARKYLNIGLPVIKITYPVMYLAGLFVEVISNIKGKKSFFNRETVRETRDAYWIYDISKISKELGYKPRVDFEQGMKDSIQWYRDRGEL